MNSEKIYDILVKFEETEQKAILINGEWGIGKTYQICKYLEFDSTRPDNDVSVHYLSLFGYKSVEEIHTRLYAMLHPVKNAALNFFKVVSPAVSLIPYVGGSACSAVQYSLGMITKAKDDAKSKKRPKTDDGENNDGFVQHIIILDDLERTKVDYIEFMGYLNQLFLQGIKVVCVCDAKRISDEKFNEFKEKVFDRQYTIEMASYEIMQSYFENISLDEEIIKVFNNNFRLASKTSLFYDEIFKIMSELKKQNNMISITDRSVLWHSSLVVCAFNGASFLPTYEEEKYKECIFEFVSFEIEESFSSIYEIDILKRICIYISEAQYSGKINNYASLLIALTKAFMYDDFDAFKAFMTKKDTKEESPFQKQLFYMSKTNQKKHISWIISEVYKLTEINIDIWNSVISMYHFKNYFPSTYDEQKFGKQIAKLILDNEKIENQLAFKNTYVADCIPMLDIVENELNQIKLSRAITRLEDAFNEDDFDKIENALIEINQKDYCHSHSGVYDVDSQILNSFINHNWFLKSMKGTMTEDVWDRNRRIALFAYDYPSVRNGLKNYLDNVKTTSKDDAEIMRIDTIIKWSLKY